jgi:hypothetical protein
VNRRFVLSINLSNFIVWFLCFLIKLSALFCHLKEVLHSLSLTYQNCQCQYSQALGSLLRNKRITRTQALWQSICTWDGYSVTHRLEACKFAGQRDDSHPGQDWTGWWETSSAQNGMQLQTYVLFISGIFHLIFSDRSWLWISAKSETLRGTYIVLCQAQRTFCLIEQ